LDDASFESETLTVYGLDASLLGVVALRDLKEYQREHRLGRGGGGGERGGGGGERGAVGHRRERETFVGILSTKPIGAC